MRIKEIMSSPAITCRENDTLNTAAQLMWENDCGVIPVTGADGQIVGIVTDRDVCMATYTQGRAPRAIGVLEAMARQVFSCRAEDPVETAEQLMREKQVRRVPIIDKHDRLQGILSMNDIARAAAARKGDGFDREAIETLAAICQPRLPAVRQKATTA